MRQYLRSDELQVDTLPERAESQRFADVALEVANRERGGHEDRIARRIVAAFFISGSSPLPQAVLSR